MSRREADVLDAVRAFSSREASEATMTDKPTDPGEPTLHREWRVSFTVWPRGGRAPQHIERVTADEDDARDQLAGLMTMLSDHELRPCDKHVWKPRLEQRTVSSGKWEFIDAD